MNLPPHGGRATRPISPSLTLILLAIAMFIFGSIATADEYTWEPAARNNIFIARYPTKTGGTGGGTTFALKHNKQIYYVTARHVCNTSAKIEVPTIMTDGINAMHIATQRMSVRSDLCLYQAGPVPRFNPIKPAGLVLARRQAKVGDDLVTWGHPRGDPLTRAAGKMTGAERNTQGDLSLLSLRYTIHEAEMVVDYGASGSPVLNNKGEVVGVVTNMSKEPGFTYFVPLKELKRFIEGKEK